MLKQINASKHVKTRKNTLDDYINKPKNLVNWSIHILACFSYDAVVKDNNGSIKVDPQDFVCEIQIRTKLQDFWAI